jgi:hypothetical protein
MHNLQRTKPIFPRAYSAALDLVGHMGLLGLVSTGLTSQPLAKHCGKTGRRASHRHHIAVMAEVANPALYMPRLPPLYAPAPRPLSPVLENRLAGAPSASVLGEQKTASGKQSRCSVNCSAPVRRERSSR